MKLEIMFLNYLQTLRNPFLDQLMLVITTLGDKKGIWLFIIFLLLLFKKTRKTGIIALAALILEVIIGENIFKGLFRRTRPFEVNQAIELIVKKPRSFSFPSGHTGSSFAVASAVFFAGEREMARGMFILACLIAFSRMYLYVHYPSDIIGGIIVGVFVGYIINYIARICTTNNRRK
mgnify:CR=1 FL=1